MRHTLMNRMRGGSTGNPSYEPNYEEYHYSPHFIDDPVSYVSPEMGLQADQTARWLARKAGPLLPLVAVAAPALYTASVVRNILRKEAKREKKQEQAKAYQGVVDRKFTDLAARLTGVANLENLRDRKIQSLPGIAEIDARATGNKNIYPIAVEFIDASNKASELRQEMLPLLNILLAGGDADVRRQLDSLYEQAMKADEQQRQAMNKLYKLGARNLVGEMSGIVDIGRESAESILYEDEQISRSVPTSFNVHPTDIKILIYKTYPPKSEREVADMQARQVIDDVNRIGADAVNDNLATSKNKYKRMFLDLTSALNSADYVPKPYLNLLSDTTRMRYRKAIRMTK